MDFSEYLAAELAGLTRFAAVLTGDRQTAHDVLTDTLVVLAGRWRRIAALENPSAYVRKAITNTYLSDRRRHVRRRTDLSADPAAFDTMIGDSETLISDRDLLRRLLATVTPEQRAAVVMKYHLDMPDDQIAAALNCATGTVRSHLSRALRALRLTTVAPVNVIKE